MGMTPSAFAGGAQPPPGGFSFTDADCDVYRIKLKGPGDAAVVLDDSDGDGHGGISQVVLQGTTRKSKLTVSVHKGGGGDGFVDLGLGGETASHHSRRPRRTSRERASRSPAGRGA